MCRNMHAGPTFPCSSHKNKNQRIIQTQNYNSRLITCLSKNPLLSPRRRQQQDRTSKLYKSSTQNPSSSSPPPQKKRKLIRWFWLPFRNLFNSLSAVSLQFQTKIQLQREREITKNPEKRRENGSFKNGRGSCCSLPHLRHCYACCSSSPDHGSSSCSHQRWDVD